MSDNWRIKSLLDDRTSKVLSDTPTGQGFTVVDAPRGGLTPIRFSPGETTRIIENYGTPNKDNVALLEAIEYNLKYPLFISAPQGEGGRVGGAFITKTGIVPFPGGIDPDDDFQNLANTAMSGAIGVGDGSLTAFSVIVENYAKYVNETLKLFVDGVPVGGFLVEPAVDGVESFTITTGDYAGASGSFDTATGDLTVDFSTAVAKGKKISYSVGLDLSTEGIVAVLKSIAAQADNLAVKASYDSVEEKLSVSVANKNSLGTYRELTGYPKVVSLDPESVNGFGISDYIVNSLASDFFTVEVLDSLATLEGFVDVENYVDFTGGVRGAKAAGADLVAGYDFLNQRKKYASQIVFDATGDSDVPAKFAALRASAQPFAKYLFPLPPVDVEEAKTAYESLNVDSRGLHVFWNWGIVRNLYSTAGNVASSLMGEVAAAYADARNISRYALAVAWANENGVGGQLASGRVVEMLYSADEAQLKELDTLGINPIDDDLFYGVMIKSRRTTQKALTDYSFADYSGMADIIIERLIHEVLPLQIVKLNDVAHRDRVANMADAILQPFTVAPYNGIEEYAIKCDGENNNKDVRDREEFVLQVAVKFTRKSRTLVLTLTNLPTGYKIEEAFV